MADVQLQILPHLSTFQPKTFTQHTEELTAKQFFNSYRIWVDFHQQHFANEDLRVRGLQYVLEGPAGDWIQKLLEQAAEHPIDHALPADLNEMQVVFLQQFHYKKSRSALKTDMKQIKYTPGCIIKNLCKKFEKIMGELKLSNDEAIETFLNILPPPIKIFVAGRRPETLQNICDGVNDYQNYMEILDVTQSFKATSFHDICKYCNTIHEPEELCQTIKDKISAEVLQYNLAKANRSKERESRHRSPSPSPQRSPQRYSDRDHPESSSDRPRREDSHIRLSRRDSYLNSSSSRDRIRQDYSPRRSNREPERYHRSDSHSPSRDNISRRYNDNRQNEYRSNRSDSRERYSRPPQNNNDTYRSSSRDRSRNYYNNNRPRSSSRERNQNHYYDNRYQDIPRMEPPLEIPVQRSYIPPQENLPYYTNSTEPPVQYVLCDTIYSNESQPDNVQYIPYRQPETQRDHYPPQRPQNNNYRSTRGRNRSNSNSRNTGRNMPQKSQTYYGSNNDNDPSRQQYKQGYVSNNRYQSNL